MMAPKYHHSQPSPISTRPRCPVCGTAVYSLAGIHPQCAVRQADPPRPKVKPLRAGIPAIASAILVEPGVAEIAAVASTAGSHPTSIET
jgi:hypothetical protein